MPKLSDLLAQKAALDKQIESARRDARQAAIAQVRTLMAEHGLTAADLQGKAKPKAAAKGKPKAAGSGKKVAPKYRDPATGDTWSGRGLQPRWLKAALATGRTLQEFAL